MKGICKISFGKPEEITPIKFKKPSKLPVQSATAFPVDKIHFQETPRGCLLEFPLQSQEAVFGLGLQLKGFNHRNKKHTMRPNADPLSDSGDSHAPVPFYVTSEGYGVLIDTARYATFYTGYRRKAFRKGNEKASSVGISTDELYYRSEACDNDCVLVDIPTAKGADVYIFQGDNITDVVRQYYLFSGGGCMPALWGLGIFYRCFARSSQQRVLETAAYFREHRLPCDIIGLEPGWQTRSYSCSYQWNPGLFPQPDVMMADLKKRGFHVNLWEHAFVESSSPLYKPLYTFSG